MKIENEIITVVICLLMAILIYYASRADMPGYRKHKAFNTGQLHELQDRWELHLAAQTKRNDEGQTLLLADPSEIIADYVSELQYFYIKNGGYNEN